MSTSEVSVPPGIEGQVDLLEFVWAIIRYRYWLLLVAVIAACAAYGTTHLMQEKYEAYTRINLVEPDDPGGVSPDNRRAPEVLTLVEHGFILGTSRDNLRDVIMVKMRSRTFTESFIDAAGVDRQLYPEQWNTIKGEWKSGQPDRNLVYSEFHETIRFVDHNPKTDIMSVRMRFTDPKVVAKWANLYVSEFNRFMRERALEEATKKIAYLVDQARDTEIVEMQKSIYRLIEAQTAMVMLAKSKSEFAVEVLDRAYEPFERFSPARKRIAILTFFAALLIGVFFVCVRVAVRRLGSALRTYKP